MIEFKFIIKTLEQKQKLERKLERKLEHYSNSNKIPNIIRDFILNILFNFNYFYVDTIVFLSLIRVKRDVDEQNPWSSSKDRFLHVLF